MGADLLSKAFATKLGERRAVTFRIWDSRWAMELSVLYMLSKLVSKVASNQVSLVSSKLDHSRVLPVVFSAVSDCPYVVGTARPLAPSKMAYSPLNNSLP